MVSREPKINQELKSEYLASIGIFPDKINDKTIAKLSPTPT